MTSRAGETPPDIVSRAWVSWTEVGSLRPWSRSESFLQGANSPRQLRVLRLPPLPECLPQPATYYSVSHGPRRVDFFSSTGEGKWTERKERSNLQRNSVSQRSRDARIRRLAFDSSRTRGSAHARLPSTFLRDEPSMVRCQQFSACETVAVGSSSAQETMAL